MRSQNRAARPAPPRALMRRFSFRTVGSRLPSNSRGSCRIISICCEFSMMRASSPLPTPHDAPTRCELPRSHRIKPRSSATFLSATISFELCMEPRPCGGMPGVQQQQSVRPITAPRTTCLRTETWTTMPARFDRGLCDATLTTVSMPQNIFMSYPPPTGSAAADDWYSGVSSPPLAPRHGDSLPSQRSRTTTTAGEAPRTARLWATSRRWCGRTPPRWAPPAPGTASLRCNSPPPACITSAVHHGQVANYLPGGNWGGGEPRRLQPVLPLTLHCACCRVPAERAPAQRQCPPTGAPAVATATADGHHHCCAAVGWPA